MRDIKELDKFFKKFSDAIVDEVFDATNKASQELNKDVQNRIEIPPARNPGQFIEYKNSIEDSVELKKSGMSVEIKGEVFSDLKVTSDDKWNGVPVGAFLEWGTGRLGETSNRYEHGYPYTTEHPWDYYTANQFKQTGTFGITARPHFVPALNAYKYKYEEKVKEAIKKAWKK